VTESWTCHHFALANPRDDRPDDLPGLLRRVADEIDSRGISPGHVLDLTVSQETTAEGPWWSVTVYWSGPALGREDA
jgi:hypothetical protein